MLPDRTRKLLLSVLSILFLLACQISNPGAPSAVPTQPPASIDTLIPTQAASSTPAYTVTPSETPAPSATPTPTARARRVVILSIDGLRPDAIQLAPMQNLLKLIQTSAFSTTAQTT